MMIMILLMTTKPVNIWCYVYREKSPGPVRTKTTGTNNYYRNIQVANGRHSYNCSFSRTSKVTAIHGLQRAALYHHFDITDCNPGADNVYMTTMIRVMIRSE